MKKHERIALLDQCLDFLDHAIACEQNDYPALHAKSHIDKLEANIEKWKTARKFAKLNGKWL